MYTSTLALAISSATPAVFKSLVSHHSPLCPCPPLCRTVSLENSLHEIRLWFWSRISTLGNCGLKCRIWAARGRISCSLQTPGSLPLQERLLLLYSALGSKMTMGSLQSSLCFANSHFLILDAAEKSEFCMLTAPNSEAKITLWALSYDLTARGIPGFPKLHPFPFLSYHINNLSWQQPRVSRTN